MLLTRNSAIIRSLIAAVITLSSTSVASAYSIGPPKQSEFEQIAALIRSSGKRSNTVSISERDCSSQSHADGFLKSLARESSFSKRERQGMPHYESYKSSFDSRVARPSLVSFTIESSPDAPVANRIVFAIRALATRTRTKIEKLGIFPFIVYNIVSQINFGTTMGIAWYMFNVHTGLSPWASGEWKRFLGFYARFLVLNQFIRPIRLAASLAFSPKVEGLCLQMEERFGWQRTKAIVLTSALLYYIAMLYSATCILAASTLSGVPILAPAS